MADILRATGADNRGDDEHPFGFVYFSDNMRVIYTSTKHGDGIRYTIGEGSGGWGEITDAHRRIAAEYLNTRN